MKCINGGEVDVWMILMIGNKGGIIYAMAVLILICGLVLVCYFIFDIYYPLGSSARKCCEAYCIDKELSYHSVDVGNGVCVCKDSEGGKSDFQLDQIKCDELLGGKKNETEPE